MNNFLTKSKSKTHLDINDKKKKSSKNSKKSKPVV